jgi:hypothetical protein
MVFDRRTRRFAGAGLGVAALIATAATLSANPAAAGIITAVTTVSCSVTGSNWCISGNNSSSGIGVIGTSKTGTGLRGTSTSQYGLKATSVSGDAILAQTTSGNAAISASAGTNGYGVSSTGRIGLYGDSANNNYGVYGTTSSGAGYGVVGLVGANGVGTYGSSNSGYGVEGLASTGTAGYFSSGTGYAVIAQAAGSVALYANNSAGNGSDIRGTYIALLGRSPTSGFPLALTDPSGNNLFYVDGNGNVSYKGGLFHFTSVAGGATVKAFSPNAAQPTIEDSGTAQLVAGAAAVRLDSTFAASIDASGGYRVFLTPNGDTRGLFVATKTPTGFVVRESQGGHSTVSFDYRILATSLGHSGERMGISSGANGGANAPGARVPSMPPGPTQVPPLPR